MKKKGSVPSFQALATHLCKGESIIKVSPSEVVMENALMRLILTVSERGYLELTDLDIIKDARRATLDALSSSRHEQADKQQGEHEDEQDKETDLPCQSRKRVAPAESEDVRKRLHSAVKPVTPTTIPPSNPGSSSSTRKRRREQRQQVPATQRASSSPPKIETHASPEFFKEFKMPELVRLSQWVPKCQISHQERAVPLVTRKHLHPLDFPEAFSTDGQVQQLALPLHPITYKSTHISLCTPLDRMGHDLSRALVEAARAGDVETLQRLIDEGADVNGKCDGITPLIAAAMAGKTVVVKSLLGSKASVEVRDDDSYTVITLALDNGQKAIAELLAEHSTNVTDPRLPKGEIWLREEFEKIYNNVKDPDSKPSRDLLEKVINGFVSGELKKLEGLEKRTVSEVYWEHILLRYIWDIKRNYSEDLELSLVGTYDEILKGHEGIKRSETFLNDELRTTKYDIVGTVVEQANNWVTERWGYHDVKNSLQVVDGIGTFLIEGAKITKNMINYTVENHVDSREEYEKKIGLRA